MDGGWFNIDHNGMIFTERKSPTKIKYLKVLQSKNSSRYTLYGNTQDNVFECVGDRGCEMYGYLGGDEFYETYLDSTFTIEDFKNNNGDGDKLILKNGLIDLLALEKKNGAIALLTVRGSDKKSRVYGSISLRGPSLEEVQEWLEVASGRFRETAEGKKLSKINWDKKKEDNPIQIK